MWLSSASISPLLGFTLILASLTSFVISSNTEGTKNGEIGVECFPSSILKENKDNSNSTSNNSSIPITTVPITSPGKNLTQSKLEFSLDMFHKLYEDQKQQNKSNLFFSPHSIHQALLLSLFGAQGNTEAELRKALKVGEEEKASLLSQYKIDAYFQNTACNLAEKHPGIELRVANKLFFDKEEPVTECIKTLFPSEVEQISISKDPETARKYMNSWVENATSGHIQDLIPGPLRSNSRLAIVNSAYFKGTWDQQFKKSKTKLGLFYAADDEVVPTYMMHAKGHFKHGISEELKSYILELPYESQAISMFILLPPFVPNSLETTISRLTAESLHRAILDENLVHDSIEVILPRFKLEQTFGLGDALATLGIHDLFNSSASNLGGFSKQAEGLYVDQAIHKAYLEVNEEGATAAAATALIGTRSGRPLDQTRFVANHPFLLLIVDNCSESVLFLGAVHKPK